MLVTAILSTVLITSVISGILGMAGGMILMAVLVALLPVATAMVLHGAVQATANGSRAWFLRRHIHWQVLPPYVLGATGALGIFLAVAFVPHPGLVLLTLGALTWLGRLLPGLRGMNICQKPTAVACGVVITAAQLLAGASGPLLDLFYLNAPLDRHQVVATKALTQTLGHLVKLGYYGAIGVSVGQLPADATLVGGAAVLAAIAGTRIGTRLLDRVPEAAFRRASSWVILTIATVCVASGVAQLVNG